MIPKPSGHIYFVQAETIGHIKIGWTGNLPDRLKSLRTSSPVPLRLLGAIWAEMEIERVLHGAFKEDRVCGEWFKPHALLLEYIRDHAAKPVGLYTLHTEGGARAWKAGYNVGCRLCLAIIPSGTEGYRFDRADGDRFDACAKCSFAGDGIPRESFELG